jgi:hypothetical protein
MGMNDGHDIRPRLENRRVDKAFEIELSAVIADRLPVQAQFDDILGADQIRRQRARDQEMDSGPSPTRAPTARLRRKPTLPRQPHGVRIRLQADLCAHGGGAPSSAPRAAANLPVSLELSGDGFLAEWGHRETRTTDRISKNEQHPLVDACRVARITPAASNTFRSNGWAVDTLHPAYEVHRM